MQAEDRARLLHMIEAAEAASNFVKGRVRQDLDTDAMLLFALVRAVEVFGEAAAKVSSSAKASSPNLPWQQIVAMRNRLIHAYFDIDHDILWKTATEERKYPRSCRP
ncbi:MAG TPA: HepT-like ribonuclease domain-containing protein [Rhizomicrobium sp.]|jgi:uncharacterized protein with HEPN domain|nr:HepT-like ribonuclease domain-containing protein [Rhizomicrobium sp.]